MGVFQLIYKFEKYIFAIKYYHVIYD